MSVRALVGALLVLLLPIGSAMAQSGQPYFDEAAKALQRNDIGLAKEKILAGLRLEPDHANAMVNLGNIYLMEKNAPEAKKWLDRALKIDPTNAIGLNSRGLIWLQEGNLDKAVDSFVASVKSDPRNPTPVLNLGDLSMQVGDSINAIRYYDMVLQIDANNVRANTMLAELHTAAGVPDKGAAFAAKALQVDPKSGPAMAAMGRIYAAKGEWLRSVDFLWDAAKAMPRDAKVRHDLGVALMNTRQFGPAAEAFLEALDLDDSDPGLHLQLGIAYYMSKKPELAEYAKKEFKHVFDRKPTPEVRGSAWYHLALLEDDAGRFDAALKNYAEALKANPRHVGAANNTGLILAQQQKFKQAIPYYQRSLKANPDFVAARFNLGYAYLKVGDEKQARAELLKLMNLPDNDPFKNQAKQLLSGKN